MEEMKHSVDNYFNDKLFDLELVAPSDVWSKIDNEMQHKKFRLWRIAAASVAASLALVVATVVGYYWGASGAKTSIVDNLPRSANNEKNQTKATGAMVTSSLGNSHTGLPANAIVPIFASNSNDIARRMACAVPVQVQEEETHTFENNNPVVMLPLLPKALRQLPLYVPKGLAMSATQLNSLLGMDENTSIFDADNLASNDQWQLGGNFSPLYSYRNLSDNSTAVKSTYYNNAEKPLLAYSGGLNMSVLRNRWRFESGVYYSEMGQKVDNILYYNNLDGESDKLANAIDQPKNSLSNQSKNTYLISNSAGRVASSGDNISGVYLSNSLQPMPTSTISQTSMEQRFKYVEIPLLAHYMLVDQSFDIYCSGGLSANFLVGNKVTLTEKNTEISSGKTEKVSSVNYAGLMGLSFVLPLHNRFDLKIEPRFRYYLNSLNNSGTLHSNFYSFGVFSGVSYTF